MPGKSALHKVCVEAMTQMKVQKALSPNLLTYDEYGVWCCCLCQCSCHVPWPTKPGALRYPDVLHNLVSFCLSVDPDRRPFVSRVLEQVDDLLSRPDALPDPCLTADAA